jgi:hypothetical protein
MTSESLYTKLFEEYSRLDHLHPYGIAVSTPTVFGKREGSLKIHEEGEIFSGIEQVDNAEAWITPVAAAHITSSVATSIYVSEAHKMFGNRTCIPPRYKELEKLSPQVVLWWKRINDINAYDFIEMNKLNTEEKQSLCYVVERKLIQGIGFVTQIKGKPILWGTWGYGTKEEREKEGFTRGGPTLKDGHMHISFFDPDGQDVELQELSVKDKLNHYSPFNNMILDRFGDAISQIIIRESTSIFRESPVSVGKKNEIESHKNGAISLMNGIEIKFDKARFGEVFELLTRVSGKFEVVYQKLQSLYCDYYCSTDGKNVDKIWNEAFDYLERQGFPLDSISESIKFIFSIKPTLGQLLLWQTKISQDKEKSRILHKLENLIDKYKSIDNRLRNYNGDLVFLSSIIGDQVKYPSDESITQTMPVHASFCYIIDNYNLIGEGLFINSLHLYPEFLTTESAAERRLGLVLKRPIK